jgi:hypothetical protein
VVAVVIVVAVVATVVVAITVISVIPILVMTAPDSAIAIVIVVVAVPVLPSSGMPAISISIPIPVAGLPPLVCSLGFPAALDPDISSVLPFTGSRNPEEARARPRRLLDHNGRRWGRRGDYEGGRWDVSISIDPLARDPRVLVPPPFPASSMPTRSRAFALRVPALPEIRRASQLVVPLNPNETLAAFDAFGWRRRRSRRRTTPTSRGWSCSPTAGGRGSSSPFSRWRARLSQRPRTAFGRLQSPTVHRRYRQNAQKRDRVRNVQQHRMSLTHLSCPSVMLDVAIPR